MPPWGGGEPFVRLRGDLASAGHCGLGLAIVAQITRLLGARVIQRPHDGRRAAIGIAVPYPSTRTAS